MKVDVTGLVFPDKHYLRVLMQQGRVSLDRDYNELQEIILRHMHTLASDLIGPHGGPGDAFKIGAIDGAQSDFAITPGHYYVSGFLCDNPGTSEGNRVAYTKQIDYPQSDELVPLPKEERLEAGNSYLVYLDVWERAITSAEDDGIREVALGGSDTTARSRVVWQVKVLQLNLTDKVIVKDKTYNSVTDLEKEGDKRLRLLGFDELLRSRLQAIGMLNRGRLAARVQPSQISDDPCILPPEAGYRGQGNNLYRVEIHKGGSATHGDGTGATFTWSAENGSTVFPIVQFGQEPGSEHATVRVRRLGQDPDGILEEGDCVSYEDDFTVRRELAGPLFRVIKVDHPERGDQSDLMVTLSSPQGTVSFPPSYGNKEFGVHPQLRRWHSDCEEKVIISESEGDGWIPLDNGIEVRFSPEEGGDLNLRTGAYWQIPARAILGNVQWPQKDDPPEPQAVVAHGIAHYYAPLARITLDGVGKIVVDGQPVDYRRTFTPLSERP
jgi:hypothetical protein